MPEKYYVIANHADPAHENENVCITVGEWARSVMRHRCIKNTELWRRLKDSGYVVKPNFISNILTDKNKIPLERIPLFVRCLGFEGMEAGLWVARLLEAYLPVSLHGHVLDDGKLGRLMWLDFLEKRRAPSPSAHLRPGL